MKKLLLILLLAIPFSAQAGTLGLDNNVKGEYNIDTNTTSLTAQVGKTIGLYGFSVTGDIDFDLLEFSYEGVDFRAEYDVLDANNAAFYISSGMDTNWAMEEVTVGLEINF